MTEHAETSPRQHWRDKVDLMVAICALVTSMASIYLSVSQGDDMQRLVQAQSWPFLGLTSGNTRANPLTGGQDAIISMEIENLGVGPAKIESLEVWWQGKPVTSSRELLQACCIPPEQRESLDLYKETPLLTSGTVGRVLRAGQSVMMFSWERPTQDPAVWNRLDKARFKIERRICYCSVFDECWTSDLSSTKATPVQACPVVAKPFRE